MSLQLITGIAQASANQNTLEKSSAGPAVPVSPLVLGLCRSSAGCGGGVLASGIVKDSQRVEF